MHDHYASRDVDPACPLCVAAVTFAPLTPVLVHDVHVYSLNAAGKAVTTTGACCGCDWTGYSHVHQAGEDGPKDGCCNHTCPKGGYATTN